MKRVMTIFAISLLMLALGACEKKDGEGSETDDGAATETAEIPAEYEEQAKSEITKDNAEEEAAKLEAEIDSEL